jgi:DNA-binding XRE family transcriptional regulator
MNTNEIKAYLARKGIRQNDLAKRLKISRQVVCDVIAGRKTSARVEKALIKAGVPRELLK